MLNDLLVGMKVLLPVLVFAAIFFLLAVFVHPVAAIVLVVAWLVGFDKRKHEEFMQHEIAYWKAKTKQ